MRAVSEGVGAACVSVRSHLVRILWEGVRAASEGGGAVWGVWERCGSDIGGFEAV